MGIFLHSTRALVQQFLGAVLVAGLLSLPAMALAEVSYTPQSQNKIATITVTGEIRQDDLKHFVQFALLNLAEILKRIRNRRAHGFKTPYGPRDQKILGAAAPILRAVGEVSVETVGI